jgi:hypothetical protein
MIDHALLALRPGAAWELEGDTLDGLTWHDTEQTRPTDAEILAKVAEFEAAEPMRQLRVERDRLIAETDWWVLPDRTPTDEQLAYRQALRDITNTYSSLDDVVWPEKP